MAYKNLKKMKLDKYELDSDTRDNLESIEQYLTNDVFSKTGWEFAEITIDGAFDANSPYVFKHNASFIPQDYLITSVRSLAEESSAGSVSILYDVTNSDYIYFICTSPGAVVRFFYGLFKESKR